MVGKHTPQSGSEAILARSWATVRPAQSAATMVKLCIAGEDDVVYLGGAVKLREECLDDGDDDAACCWC